MRRPLSRGGLLVTRGESGSVGFVSSEILPWFTGRRESGSGGSGIHVSK